MPDTYKTIIVGNPDVNNSLSLCLRFVLGKQGVDTTHEYISGLLGTAFSPAWALGEDCTAWWMEGGDDDNIVTVGDVLGFSAIRPKTELEARDVIEKTDKLKELYKEMRAWVKEGLLVVQKTWPTSTVVVGWDDEGDEPERAGFEGFPLFDSPDGAFAIKLTEPRMSKEEAFVKALENGKAYANGDFKRVGFTYGGELYKEMARVLREEEHFCVPCSKPPLSDLGCFMRTLARMVGVAREFVGFVDATSEFHGNKAESLARAKQINLQMEKKLKELHNHPELEDLWQDRNFRKELAEGVEGVYKLHREFAKSF
ncbi:MAG TPA: hypothetical protein PKV16_08065 [Caldisericia bacterium]|nr:hypothetical protein [Caldisericia bacterium]HPF49729.1 hypothetical protein [Caldisericia bacterium]HPI84291.1 hypothetical protein [Caldisericia bacterium]HPQ93718.1 hypothetical protein [Caldisericia bacterium]HRV74858.1 hypothetical protein [Caldisericia bacterium]